MEKDEKMTNIQLESEDILHKKRIQKKPSKICSANLWQKKWNRKIDAQETTIQLVSDSEYTLHKKNVKKTPSKITVSEALQMKKREEKNGYWRKYKTCFQTIKIGEFWHQKLDSDDILI